MKETRIFAAPVEVRGDAENGATIAGYAAVFDTPYDVGGMFMESVSRKAFTKTLRDRSQDLAVVWSHDADRVLGTVESNTARFAVDEHGLHYEADLDLADPDGLSAYRKITTGKVRQSSFSFEVVRDEWTKAEDGGLPQRLLREVRLWEASPVLWGSNTTTEVDIKRAARSLAETTDIDAEAVEEALSHGALADVFPNDDTTETPDETPPDEAPLATSPPEPSRSDMTL